MENVFATCENDWNSGAFQENEKASEISINLLVGLSVDMSASDEMVGLAVKMFIHAMNKQSQDKPNQEDPMQKRQFF